MIDTSTTAGKYENAKALVGYGEDGALYLATVCSMTELAKLSKDSSLDQELVKEAKDDQHRLARHGKVIRII